MFLASTCGFSTASLILNIGPQGILSFSIWLTHSFVDLAELSETAKADVDSSVGEETMNEEGEVSLDEISDSEEPAKEDTQEDQ